MVDPHCFLFQQGTGKTGFDRIHFHTSSNTGEQQRGGKIINVRSGCIADQVVLPFHQCLFRTDYLCAESQ